MVARTLCEVVRTMRYNVRAMRRCVCVYIQLYLCVQKLRKMFRERQLRQRRNKVEAILQSNQAVANVDTHKRFLNTLYCV